MQMKQAPKSKEQLREEADATLRSVGELMSCPAFTGFYLAMLRAKRNEHDEAVLRNAGLLPEEREIRRRIGREYDEILLVHEKAAAQARRTAAVNQ